MGLLDCVDEKKAANLKSIRELYGKIVQFQETACQSTVMLTEDQRLLTCQLAQGHQGEHKAFMDGNSASWSTNA